MKAIAGLTTNSSGTIRADRILADGLRITIHSSGSIEIASLSARILEVEITSSGHVALAGSVERQTVRCSSGNLRYRGNPQKVTVSATSSGGLVRLD